MRGNSHVRFLGGGGAEMPCCYPTSRPLPQALPSQASPETDPAGESRRGFCFKIPLRSSPSASRLPMLPNIRIVLVQTYHPGNIGAAARAMKTMGLTDLVLINPRRFPDPEATRLAAGAEELVENARVVGSLAEAVADCVQVVGASARLRSLPLPHFDEPDAMARELVEHAATDPVALVFGRERSGLTNDEIRLCSHQVSIPANPEYGILNLSQAVQVLATRRSRRGVSARRAATCPSAPRRSAPPVASSSGISTTTWPG